MAARRCLRARSYCKEALGAVALLAMGLVVGASGSANATLAILGGVERVAVSAPGPVTEGNSGTTPMVFTLTTPTPPTTDCDLAVTFTNGLSPVGQIWPANWVPASPLVPGGLVQIVTIKAGTTSTTATVNVIGDTIVEPDGSVQATVSYWSVGPSLNTCEVTTPGVVGVATGGITDDDTAPVKEAVAITAPGPVTEGNSGTTPMVFTLTTPTPPTTDCDLAVTFTNGLSPVGQIWPANWVPASPLVPGGLVQIVTIKAGTTSTTATVNVIGDTIVEPDGSVQATISYWSVGPSLKTCEVKVPGVVQIATGGITDDDTAGLYKVGNAAVTEGDSGSTPMVFAITSSAAPTNPCQVLVTALNETALLGPDWTFDGQTLTYAKVVTFSAASETFTIGVVGDTVAEVPLKETMSLSIVGFGLTPCGVEGLLSKGIGTITDNDVTASYSVGDSTVTEGDASIKPMAFAITSPVAPAAPCQVLLTALNVSALLGPDWTFDGQTATFVKVVTLSSASESFTIGVVGDTVPEVPPSETMTVSIAGFGFTPCGVSGVVSTGTGTIIDNDVLTAYTVSNAAVTEGDSGTTPMVFAITSPVAPTAPCQVLVTALNVTALLGPDWAFDGQTLTFTKVVTLSAASESFVIGVVGDTIAEVPKTETMTLSIAGTGLTPCAVSGLISTGTGTITDNDIPPIYSINSVSVTEGNSGTTPMVFTISSPIAPGAPCQMLVTALNVTAAWTSDWNLSGEPLWFKTITVSGASTTVTIDALGDLLPEADETFTVSIVGTGTNPCLVDITKSIGTGTIVNDDGAAPTGPPRSVSVNDVTVIEGNAGTTAMTFTLTLDGPANGNETVAVGTAPGTASAGSDFVSLPLTLVTFAPGETTKTVTITINGDTTPEPNETLTLNLSGPTNVTVAKATGVGVIRNDDRRPGGPPTTAPAPPTTAPAPPTTAPAPPTTAPAPPTTAPAPPTTAPAPPTTAPAPPTTAPAPPTTAPAPPTTAPAPPTTAPAPPTTAPGHPVPTTQPVPPVPMTTPAVGTCVLGHNPRTGEHCYTEGYSDPKDRPAGYPIPPTTQPVPPVPPVENHEGNHHDEACLTEGHSRADDDGDDGDADDVDQSCVEVESHHAEHCETADAHEEASPPVHEYH
jgi:hypothetical protein